MLYASFTHSLSERLPCAGVVLGVGDTGTFKIETCPSGGGRHGEVAFICLSKD